MRRKGNHASARRRVSTGFPCRIVRCTQAGGTHRPVLVRHLVAPLCEVVILVLPFSDRGRRDDGVAGVYCARLVPAGGRARSGLSQRLGGCTVEGRASGARAAHALYKTLGWGGQRTRAHMGAWGGAGCTDARACAGPKNAPAAKDRFPAVLAIATVLDSILTAVHVLPNRLGNVDGEKCVAIH